MYLMNLDNVSGIEQDRIKKYIEDKLRIKITYKTGNGEDYDTKLVTAMAAGDAPDLVIDSKYGLPMFSEWVKEELVVDIGKMVRDNPERYPALDLYYKTNANVKPYNAVYTGDPEATHLFYASHYAPRAYGGYMFNNNYLKALNLQVPTTIDEFVEVLRAIKNGDPDNNGKKDTVPFSFVTHKGAQPSESLGPFFTTMGTQPKDFFQDKNGVWLDGAIADKSKEVWKQIAAMYKEGLIDREVITNDPPYKLLDDFVAGTTAVIDTRGPLTYKGAFETYQQKYPNATVDEIVMPAEPLKGPEGYAQDSSVPTGMDYMVFIPTSSKNPDRVLDLLNFIVSDEGQTLLWYGIEGVHHTKDASGNLVLNEEEFAKEAIVYYPTEPKRMQYRPFTEFLNDWYFYMQLEKNGGLPEALNNAVDLLTERYGTSPAADYMNTVHNKYLELGYTAKPAYYDFVSLSDDEKKVKTELDEIRVRWTTKFLIGQSDVEKDWDKYVQEYKAAGADALLQSYVAKLEEEKRKFEALQ